MNKANRDALLGKVRALLSKTIENGCTEAEALAALAKARAMRDAYVISDDELQLTKEQAAEFHSEPSDATDPHKIKWQLSHAIGKFCDCRVYLGPDGLFKFCGMAGDAQFAMWLLDHLTDFVSAELVKHLMFCLAPKAERQSVIKSFIAGCAATISEHMLKLCDQSADHGNVNSHALTLVKSAAVDAKLAELGINLRTVKRRRRTVDETAYEAGLKAGKDASFGRPVEGDRAVLRLGKPTT